MSPEGEPTKPIETESPDEFTDTKKDIISRSKGSDGGINPGALRVLHDLAQKGPEIYQAVAPQLGTGSEIWLKYKDECGEDLDTLIEKYGKKE